MRVLHLSNYYPGLHKHSGGAEQAMEWTIGLHAELGIDNTLLTCPADEGHPVDVPNHQAMTLETLFPRLKGVVEPVKWYAGQFDPLVWIKMAQLVRREGYDAVHVGNAQFLTLGLLPALRALGIPVLLSVYDYWLFCPLTTLIRREQAICHVAQGQRCIGCLPDVHRLAQRGLLLFRPRVMASLIRAVTRFVVLSESSRRIAEAHGVEASRIRVIRLPRRPTGRPSPEVGGGQDVLLVGWQQWRKGIHVALQAWPRVRGAFPRARLHVIGGEVKFGERYRRRLDDLLETHDLAGSVELHGRVSDEELERRLRDAAVVIIPEQWENMSPLILLRSMELGKAIVASRVGGIPEFIRHEREGLLADAAAPEQFAAGVIRMLEDPPLGAQWGRAARARVHELCEPKAASRAWAGLYAGLGL